MQKWLEIVVDGVKRQLYEVAEVHDVKLVFREPFKCGGTLQINGFITTYVGFYKNPLVLQSEGNDAFPETFKRSIENIAKRKFGVEPVTLRSFDSLASDWYTSIDFTEPNEEALYALTPEKEVTIRESFERVKNFANWYHRGLSNLRNAIDKYEEAIKSAFPA